MQQDNITVSEKRSQFVIPKVDIPDIVTLIMAIVVAYQMIQGISPDTIAIGIVMGGVGKNVYGASEFKRQ